MFTLPNISPNNECCRQLVHWSLRPDSPPTEGLFVHWWHRVSGCISCRRHVHPLETGSRLWLAICVRQPLFCRRKDSGGLELCPHGRQSCIWQEFLFILAFVSCCFVNEITASKPNCCQEFKKKKRKKRRKRLVFFSFLRKKKKKKKKKKKILLDWPRWDWLTFSFFVYSPTALTFLSFLLTKVVRWNL